MKRTIFAFSFFSLTLPAFGQAVNPEGIYQLNLAKSTIRGRLAKARSSSTRK
jgi:hypothetical protein